MNTRKALDSITLHEARREALPLQRCVRRRAVEAQAAEVKKAAEQRRKREALAASALAANSAHLARRKQLAAKARLAEQQGDDGSFDGWFGKAYGTALVVLTLGGH